MKSKNTALVSGTNKKCGVNRQKGSTLWLSVFLLLIIGGLLAGGYYLWKEQITKIELLHKYVEKIETQLGIKNDTVEVFKENLAKLASEERSYDVILNDRLRMLEDDLARVGKSVRAMQDNMSSQNWLLTEVEYLIKMASQRILIKEDVAGALRLLRRAEELIRQMPGEDQGLVDVRLAISKDIASMEIYREVDVPGTYAELVAVGELIEQLPLITTEIPDVAAGDEAVSQPSMLSEINQAFAGYITIRRHDTDELRALLSPEQRINLRDSIRLSLEQAQTALLRGEQRIYDESLSRTRRWVLQYFVADHFRTQQALRRIDDLIKVRVGQDLPDIAQSQQEIKRYLTDRMRQQN